MSDQDWPSPGSAYDRPALPRLDDLPVSEHGYDREKVREAFDSFYRHAAELDAALKTLEAVDAFQRTAAELRAELRTIRAAGFTSQPRHGGYGASVERGPRFSVPEALPRVFAEAVFLIVVGVVVGVAGWSTTAIVLVMGMALAVVWLVELAASRERRTPGRPAPVELARPPADEEEPVVSPEPVVAVAAVEADASTAADSAGWSAFEAAGEDGAEAMTMLGVEAPVEAVEEAEELEPEKPEAPLGIVAVGIGAASAARREHDDEEEEEEVDVQDEPPEVAAAIEEAPPPRRHFWQRRHEEVPSEPETEQELEAEAVPEPDPEPEPEPAVAIVEAVDEPEAVEEPQLVEEQERVDPWERELDLSVSEPEPEAPAERRRFGLFRRLPAADEAEAASVAPELAVVAAAAPLVEEEAEELEEPEAEQASEPEEELEPEEPDEPEELPVELLAEQAAAALERSRARRRVPRRARRR